MRPYSGCLPGGVSGAFVHRPIIKLPWSATLVRFPFALFIVYSMDTLTNDDLEQKGDYRDSAVLSRYVESSCSHDDLNWSPDDCLGGVSCGSNLDDEIKSPHNANVGFVPGVCVGEAGSLSPTLGGGAGNSRKKHLRSVGARYTYGERVPSPTSHLRSPCRSPKREYVVPPKGSAIDSFTPSPIGVPLSGWFVGKGVRIPGLLVRLDRLQPVKLFFDNRPYLSSLLLLVLIVVVVELGVLPFCNYCVSHSFEITIACADFVSYFIVAVIKVLGYLLANSLLFVGRVIYNVCIAFGLSHLEGVDWTSASSVVFQLTTGANITTV